MLFRSAEVRRFYGAMLIERDESSDHEYARALLTQARDTYNQVGMPRHRTIVEALLNKLDHP